MFIGKYYYRLEAKGRVSLPKSFRADQKNWVITRGLDGALFLFPKKAYETEVNKLAQLSTNRRVVRDAIRLLSNDAANLTPDKLGRISIPEHLIKSSGLTKNLVIVGSISKIEIWDREVYHTYIETLTKHAETTIEQLDS